MIVMQNRESRIECIRARATSNDRNRIYVDLLHLKNVNNFQR